MKRMLAMLLLGVALVISAAAQAAEQQKYTVQPGDTLWDLASTKLGNPSVWKQIVQDNPFLQKEGRIISGNDGKIYALIKPGEKLAGLEKLGILPKVVPASDLVFTDAGNQVPIDGVVVPWVNYGYAGLALLLFMLTAYLIHRMLTRDPVTSGPPMVPGGITAETAGEHFARMAQRYAAGRQVEILETTPGRGWGIMNIEYRNRGLEPRRLNGERVFQARVRLDGNEEEMMYMLEGCGNPLRFNDVMRYVVGEDFRFVADSAQQPATAPAAAAPAAPATEVATAAEVSSEEGPPQKDRLVVVYNAANGNQPALIQLTGAIKSFTFRLKDDGSPSFRFRENEASPTPTPTPAPAAA